MNLSNQLKYYLKAYGISAAELSRRARVPKQSISDWLGGVIPRSLPHVKSVAEVFGITMDELCYGDVALEIQLAYPTNGPVNPSTDVWITGFFEGQLRKISIDEISIKKKLEPK